MIVYLGPQFVQFINGYANLRLLISCISSLQSSHIEISGLSIVDALLLTEFSISKLLELIVFRELSSIESILDSGGFDRLSSDLKEDILSSSPSISITTPFPSLLTKPNR
jgi:hypothetical protein